MSQPTPSQAVAPASVAPASVAPASVAPASVAPASVAPAPGASGAAPDPGATRPAVPVVFVHGLWMRASSWTPWVDLFNERGYAAVAFQDIMWRGDRLRAGGAVTGETTVDGERRIELAMTLRTDTGAVAIKAQAEFAAEGA